MKAKNLAIIIAVFLIGISLSSINISLVSATTTSLTREERIVFSDNVFSDNFECYAYKNGKFPSAGGWKLIWNGRGDKYQIVTKEHALGGKSLQLWGKPGWLAVVSHDIITDADIIGCEQAIMISERNPNTSGTPYEKACSFWNRNIGQWGKRYPSVLFDHRDSTIRAYNGNERKVIGKWKKGKWYKVKIIINRSENRYKIWINDSYKGKFIPSPNSLDPYKIKSLELASEHPGVKVFHDNVKIFDVIPTVRIWPSEAPVTTCYDGGGKPHPATGPDSAAWFYYGGSGGWKIFDVTPGVKLKLIAHGDEGYPCPACVLGDINYHVDDYYNEKWNEEKYVNGPDNFNGFFAQYYTPKGDRIRIRAESGFYIHCFSALYSSTDITGITITFLDEDGDGIPGLKAYQEIWNNYGVPVYTHAYENVEFKVAVEGGVPPYDFDYKLSLGNYSISGKDLDHDNTIEIQLSKYRNAPIGKYKLSLKVKDGMNRIYSCEDIGSIYLVFNPSMDFREPPDPGYISGSDVHTNGWRSEFPPSLPFLKCTSEINLGETEILKVALSFANSTSRPLNATSSIARKLSSWGYKVYVCYENDTKNFKEMRFGEGANCAGHTVVFVSMARSLRIPSREAILYVGKWIFTLPCHEFAEVYNGSGWYPSDPTSGRTGWESFGRFLEEDIRLRLMHSVKAYDPSGNEINRTYEYRSAIKE